MTDVEKEVQNSVKKAVKRELHRLTQEYEYLKERLKSQGQKTSEIRRERDLYKTAYEALAKERTSTFLTVNSYEEPML